MVIINHIFSPFSYTLEHIEGGGLQLWWQARAVWEGRVGHGGGYFVWSIAGDVLFICDKQAKNILLSHIFCRRSTHTNLKQKFHE